MRFLAEGQARWMAGVILPVMEEDGASGVCECEWMTVSHQLQYD